MSHDLPAVREQLLPPAHFMDPASGMPPLISFSALASGTAPLIYRPANVPERARITKAMARAVATPAVRTPHGFRGGLASPDLWEDLLAAAGKSAQVFVVDKNGQRWRVEEVDFDYGGETGKVKLRNVGPLGVRWVRLHEAYGRMIPVVQYKPVKSARRNPGDPTCTIVSLDEDSDFEDMAEVTDRDPWSIVEEAEGLFSRSGIRVDWHEKLHGACIDAAGRVLGVSAIGSHGGHDEGDDLQRPLYSFSVAVSEDDRRKGVGNRLVEDLIRCYPRDEFLLEGKVVNPHMATLLTKHGFFFEIPRDETEEQWTDWDRQTGRRMYRPNPSPGAPRRTTRPRGPTRR